MAATLGLIGNRKLLPEGERDIAGDAGLHGKINNYMQTQIPSYFKKLARAAAALGVLLLLVILGLFVRGWQQNRPPTLMELSVTPETGIHLGVPVEVSARVECPWYRLPRKDMDVHGLPESLGRLGEPSRRLAGIGPGTWRWTCKVVLQPFDLGTLVPGELWIGFTENRKQTPDDVVKVLLPQLEVVGMDPSGVVLDMAGPLEAERFGWLKRWGWALALLGILMALAGKIWRQRSRPPTPVPVVPPWETASLALQQLKARLPMPAEAFFVALTDIVRDYLERRFDLPASGRTTPEFLIEMQGREQLRREHRLLLTEFLTSADMIKFARAQATQQQLEQALGQARRFVSESQPKMLENTGEGGP